MNEAYSEEMIAQAKERFWTQYNDFMLLVQKARGIEILIRICTELQETYDFYVDKHYEQFRDSNYAHTTKQYQKLIKEFMPAHEGQLQKVRLVADAIAHIDLVKARRKLIEYSEDFGLSQQISDKPIGMVLLKNVTGEDGVVRDMAHLANSGEDNLLTEEMEIFVRQGCFKAAETLFDDVRAMIAAEVPDIEMIDVSLRTQRALKRARPI